ncbi:MAG: hypothetical protein ACRDJC_14300 [Thermomicrobiales bacterium]
MERSFERAVRERLAAYLAGETALDEFKSWLVTATWELDHTQPSSGIRFANEIKLVLAEHSGGYRSDGELRDSLIELLNRTLVNAG